VSWLRLTWIGRERLKKGERHHWWPIALSKHWVDASGKVNVLKQDGSSFSSTPKNIARVSDGHNVLYDGPSPWDATYEWEYDEADDGMATVVSFLELCLESFSNQKSFVEIQLQPEIDRLLCICLASLVIRSPRYRESCVALAEDFRGPLSRKERNRLIASNMRGRIAFFASKNEEFIFGDGFYQNIGVNPLETSPGSMFLVPFLPHLAIMYFLPSKYSAQPRCVGRAMSADEVALVNQTTKIYSHNRLFYRHDIPSVGASFTPDKNLIYKYEDDPILELANTIPGIISRQPQSLSTLPQSHPSLLVRTFKRICERFRT